MKQIVEFDNATVFSTPGLQNKLYTWSRRHNIVFAESRTTDSLRLYFGRESELSIFLLTWDEPTAKPRVV